METGGLETGAPGATCAGSIAQATVELDALPASAMARDAGAEGADAMTAAEAGGGADAMTAAEAGGGADAMTAPDAEAADPIAGTATFAMTASGVDLAISITGCVNGVAYPVRVLEGADCTNATLSGPEWDAPRGEGATIACTGNSGIGRAYYTRPSGAPKAWSVGEPSASDVVGHVLVIDDPASMQPVACGLIAPAMDAGAPGASPGGANIALRTDVLAQITGLCWYQGFSPVSTCHRSGPAGRLRLHALRPVDMRVRVLGLRDVPARRTGRACANDCPIDPACATCMGGLRDCLLGFCFDEVACAVPTPGGPCSKLEACCAMQGPRAQGCLATVKEIEKLSGDPGCIGAMQDQDFLTHEAYDPVCTFN